MARGRKPEPAELQAGKGAPGKRMSNAEAAAVREASKQAVSADRRIEPVAIGGVRPPKWLKRSRKATEVWNQLAPLLTNLNLLHDLDALPLGRYCRYVVEWIAADDAVRKEGTWFDAVDTNGAPTKKRHPAWQACQDLEKMLREMEATFGMRPDARYKILRDQAAAAGLGGLPLFGGGARRDGGAGGREAAEQSEPAGAPGQEHDAIGLLAEFDSPPPTRMN